ncbi:MAG TPA: hypothetical protein VIH91_06375 [Terriglobales bacterium]
MTGANLSWNKGRHNLRGGFEWNHTQINHFQPQGGSFQTARGSFLFNGTVTSLPGATPTYFNSVADFLLGLPSQTGKAYQVFNPISLRWSQWAWYVRDQWQVSPNAGKSEPDSEPWASLGALPLRLQRQRERTSVVQSSDR